MVSATLTQMEEFFFRLCKVKFMVLGLKGSGLDTLVTQEHTPQEVILLHKLTVTTRRQVATPIAIQPKLRLLILNRLREERAARIMAIRIRVAQIMALYSKTTDTFHHS